MKTLLAAATIALFAAGAAHAGGCHKTCADGYTYSSDSGTCVPKQVNS